MDADLKAAGERHVGPHRCLTAAEADADALRKGLGRAIGGVTSGYRRAMGAVLLRDAIHPKVTEGDAKEWKTK